MCVSYASFISSINVVFADDLMRFRLNGNSIYDQPYGDRNEFPMSLTDSVVVL